MLDIPVSNKRAASLDALRLVLATWVLFSHLIPWAQQSSSSVPWPSALISFLSGIFQPRGETHPAVLGFIVLSGYCIHRNGLRASNWNWKAYGVRRAFRILPVYWLAGFVGIWVFGSSVAINPKLAMAFTGTSEITAFSIGLKMLGLSVLIPAWHTWSFQGNAPLVTAMVEIWLYALYPLLLALIARRGEHAMWGLLLLAWLICLSWAALDPSVRAWWHNGSLVGFLLYWWIGAKCNDSEFVVTLWSWKAYLLGAWLVLSGIIWVGVEGEFVLVELRKVVFVLVAGMIVARLDTEGNSFVRCLGEFGKASYSIYAFHGPLAICLLLMEVQWWLVALAVLSSATLVYWIYERVFINYGSQMAKYRFLGLRG